MTAVERFAQTALGRRFSGHCDGKRQTASREREQQKQSGRQLADHGNLGLRTGSA
ncbi:MAG TPA: hypothetical protein VI386_38215 [Candidatus Sulfotelmatobacter sp.]